MSDLRVVTTEAGIVSAVSIISQNGEVTSTGGGAVDSVNGHTGAVVLGASDVGAQPVDSDLTAIALLSTTTFGRNLLALVDAAALRTAAGLGTAATQASTAFDASGAAAAAQAASQPLDSDLTAIAALATTTFGRSLLTAADAAAARTLIGAGTSSLALGTTSSTAKAGDYQPAAANISDATTIGKAVLTAADAAAVRSAIGAGTSSFDGAYSSLTGKPTLGTSAAKDIPASGDASSTQVVYGTDTRLTNARTPAAHAASHAAAGSDPLTLSESQVTGLVTDLAGKAASTHTHAESDVTNLTTDLAAKLVKASNLSDVANAGTARTNLGLGGAAVLAVGTTTGTVAAGDDSRLTNSRTPTAHASTHAAAGSDPLTLDDSQVTPIAPNDQTASYTAVLADKHRLVRISNASANTFTIPPNSSVAFPLGTTLLVAQQGAGQTTVTAGAGVTIRTPHGAKTAAQYSMASATKVGTDEWYVSGDTTT